MELISKSCTVDVPWPFSPGHPPEFLICCRRRSVLLHLGVQRYGNPSITTSTFTPFYPHILSAGRQTTILCSAMVSLVTGKRLWLATTARELICIGLVLLSATRGRSGKRVYLTMLLSRPLDLQTLLRECNSECPDECVLLTKPVS